MLASNDDFVIQEQIYQMCPSCPTFSIPIPIPKTNIAKTTQKRKVIEKNPAEGVMMKIVNFFSGIINPESGQKQAISRIGAGITQHQGLSPLTLAAAGVTALGLGVATFMTIGNNVARSFSIHDAHSNTLHQLEKIDYDVTDIFCYPRTYCETMKKKKYLIDQFPMLKRLGLSVAEVLWDRDYISERGSETWCNLRECVFSILR